MKPMLKHPKPMKSLFNSAIPYIVSFFLAFVTFEAYKAYLTEHKSVIRLIDNLAAAQKENIYFQARNKDHAVKIQAQELTIKEIRTISPSVISDLRNLYIAPRQLQNIIMASTETEKHITATLRDSVIMDTIKVSVIDYRDKWFTVRGLIRGDTANLNIISRDSLTVINYLSRRPHPWLWIFGGRRHPESTITNKNPFIKYSIEKSITVKKQTDI